MDLTNLTQAKLIKRYKRFLADVELIDGSQITIHCPNTGSMKHCLFPEQPVWFSTSDNPKRKYPNTWELAQTNVGHLIGINTGRANALAEEAINQGIIAELSGYQHLKREVKYGEENSRIDILLSDDDKPNCYVEVKSCTLLDQGIGFFPDSVTIRGQKHLRELMAMVTAGHRAVLLFIVQHSGIEQVSPAFHIDEQYAKLFIQAQQTGVEIFAYSVKMSPNEVKVSKPLPINVINLKNLK